MRRATSGARHAPSETRRARWTSSERVAAMAVDASLALRAQYILGEICLRTNRVAEAIDHAQAMLDERPGFAPAHQLMERSRSGSLRLSSKRLRSTNE
jgi:hypothetical protein